MAFDMDKEISLQSLLAATSFIAIACALSYDVGYFYAVDISFFTLFSLDEHFLFAIQALPIALVILLSGALIAIFAFSEKSQIEDLIAELDKSASQQTGKNELPKVESLNTLRKSAKELYRKSKLLRIVAFIAVMFQLFLILVSFKSKGYAAAGIIALLIPLMILIVINRTVNNRAVLIYIIVSTIFSSATIGWNTARAVIHSEREAHKIDGLCENCRIIRSGSKGVLYKYNHELIFEKWDNIRSISKNISLRR